MLSHFHSWSIKPIPLQHQVQRSQQLHVTSSHTVCETIPHSWFGKKTSTNRGVMRSTTHCTTNYHLSKYYVLLPHFISATVFYMLPVHWNQFILKFYWYIFYYSIICCNNKVLNLYFMWRRGVYLSFPLLYNCSTTLSRTLTSWNMSQ